MKIYTKTGDFGETEIFCGKRISKASYRIRVSGAIDELNSSLGIIVSDLEYGLIKEKLIRVQKELFESGADVSLGFLNEKRKLSFRINKVHIQRLEREIDEWECDISYLNKFILPGGSRDGALLHFSRSICRRLERELVALSQVEKINPDLLAYFNRLSDWLFVLARYVNKLKGTLEIKFEPKYKKLTRNL